MSLDLLADGFDRGMGPQETIGQGFIFAQESQKQVLRLDIGRPELAGLVACEKDDAPGFLRIAFKHIALPPEPSRPEEPDLPGQPKPWAIFKLSLHYAIKWPRNSSTETGL